jgi:hypothetical protein
VVLTQSPPEFGNVCEDLRGLAQALGVEKEDFSQSLLEARIGEPMIYQQLNQQAAAEAYQDIYRLLCWMAIGMVVCAFILSKNKPGQAAPAGEAMH